MTEETLEAQAVEEPLGAGEDADAPTARPLPERQQGVELEAWRGEVRTAALAAVSGIVAGAATVAVVRAVRAGAVRGGGRGLLRRRPERPRIVASRSFLVDVHVLGR